MMRAMLKYQENFLSPTFLAFLPHLANEYGFEYELVTYKWPSWLRAQTEKQRIIWAYVRSVWGRLPTDPLDTRSFSWTSFFPWTSTKSSL